MTGQGPPCCCGATHGHDYRRREIAGIGVWWECWYCSDQQDGDPQQRSGPPPWPQHAREWLRFKIGWALSEPFWRVHLLGQRCHLIAQRLVTWGERGSR